MEFILPFSGEITGLNPNAKWIIGNVKERYYYRVNYNMDNWDALQSALRSDHTVIKVLQNQIGINMLISESCNLFKLCRADKSFYC